MASAASAQVADKAAPKADASATEAAKAAPAGKPRLVLQRSNASLYLGLVASVDVNGSNVANLWPGGVSTIDIAPGKTAVKVWGWSMLGSYQVAFDAKPGATYRVLIEPRSETHVPQIVTGIWAGLVTQDKKGNGGPFSARLVSSPPADPSKIKPKAK